MAFAAIHGHVFSHQREFGEIMIKELGEPVFRDMASLAIGHTVHNEVLTVHIVVAVYAG